MTEYSYRRLVTVSAPAELRDYQVQVVVDTRQLISSGKLLNDCRDVAFTDETGRVLYHYLEPNTCNTTHTRFLVKVPVISDSTVLYMLYGNDSALSFSDPYKTLLLGGNPAEYPRLYLYGDVSAVYPSYIRLTPASSNRFGAIVGMDGAPSVRVPTTPVGLYAKLVFQFTSCSSTPGDAVWLGAYDDTYVGTSEDVVKGGYHFTFDIYQSRVCFTKSTTDNGPGILCYSTSFLQNTWYTGEVYFWYDNTANAPRAIITLNGVPVVDAVDPSPQSNFINSLGIIYIAGRTSSRYCEIRLREFYVVKYYPGVTVTIGDEEYGTFGVVANTYSAVDNTPLFYHQLADVVGNTLSTTGRTFSAVDNTHVFYYHPSQLVGTTFFATNRMFTPIALDSVDIGTFCDAPNYAYSALVRFGDGTIDRGYIHLHLAHPDVYASYIIRNGRANLCLPVTPDRFRQMMAIVVDGNNVYLATVSDVVELAEFNGISLAKSYSATIDVSTTTSLPIKFVLDLEKFRRVERR